jgi:hypothetical protein
MIESPCLGKCMHSDSIPHAKCVRLIPLTHLGSAHRFTPPPRTLVPHDRDRALRPLDTGAGGDNGIAKM